jgi:exopolysaccharide biosynthesis polyprenyl glycosylphosphotransferase
MNNRRLKLFILILGDIALLYGALFVALLLRYWGAEDPPPISLHVAPFSIVFLFWLTLLGAFGLYDFRFIKNSKQFLYRLLRAMATNTVLAALVFYLFPIFEIEPRRNLFLISATATLFIFIWRYLFNIIILRTPSSGVLFFGITKDGIELSEYLFKNPQLGYKPVAFLALPGEKPESLPLPHFAYGQDLAAIIKDFAVDTVVISPEIKENRTLVTTLFALIPLGVAILEFPRFYEMNIGKISLSLIGEVWFLENLVGIKKTTYEFFKRALDIFLSVFIAIPASFLFPIIALAIRIDSEGPIFFRQKRVGRGGKDFGLIKFRSMVKNAESLNGFKGSGRDLRHTRVGAFLRKNYLDELPQIINIFRGEMSFIGPRPERPEYVQKLKEKIPFYEMRLLVPPGITGWAQIHMENDASVEDAPEKLQFDLYYIKNRSMILDLLITIKTLFTILRREGR